MKEHPRKHSASVDHFMKQHATWFPKLCFKMLHMSVLWQFTDVTDTCFGLESLKLACKPRFTGWFENEVSGIWQKICKLTKKNDSTVMFSD